MNTKKALALALSFLMAAFLGGCGSSSSSDDTVKIDSSKPSQSVGTTKKATPPQGATE